MKEGKLIVIEGACDGIGKSTQYKLIKERLEKDGYNVSSHHFPSYDTPEASPVEEYLKGEFGKPEDISPYFINGLYAIDRGATWLKKLKPLYDKGNIILLDRYTPSSLIYQSALIEDTKTRKDFINYVIDFEYNKIGIKEPDCVIFLDADFDVVNKLRKMRKDNEGIVDDIHEKDEVFMKKVHENAQFVADYLNFSKIKCDDKDAMRKIEDIHEDIFKVIKKTLEK